MVLTYFMYFLDYLWPRLIKTKDANSIDVMGAYIESFFTEEIFIETFFMASIYIDTSIKLSNIG